MDNSSLNHYTFTEEEQNNATHICAQMTRHRISKRQPTYIDLTVRLDSHKAALQITITPSLHPLLPRQTIISLHCRYGLCCQSIPGEAARERIRQTVQGVVGAYFQLFEWDFSDEDCYTGDLAASPCVPNHSCPSAAQAILPNHNASTTREPNVSADRRPAPKAKRRCPNATKSRRNLSNEDIVERLTRKTVKGLLKCRQQSRPHSQLNILDTFRSFDIGSSGSYIHYATKLVEVADKLEHQARAQRMGSWYTRFLASCITIASPSLPALPAETPSDDSPKDRLQIAHQQSVARIVNMIVRGLWNDWGEKAFLMYRAFAEINYKFHNIQSLGVDRLSTIAQNTVKKLKEVEVPSFGSKEDLFDPSWMLCQFLKFRNYQVVCNALELPSLQSTDGHGWSPRQANSSLALSLPGHAIDELFGSGTVRHGDIQATGSQVTPFSSHDDQDSTSRDLDRGASSSEPLPLSVTGGLQGGYDIFTSTQDYDGREVNSRSLDTQIYVSPSAPIPRIPLETDILEINHSTPSSAQQYNSLGSVISMDHDISQQRSTSPSPGISYDLMLQQSSDSPLGISPVVLSQEQRNSPRMSHNVSLQQPGGFPLGMLSQGQETVSGIGYDVFPSLQRYDGQEAISRIGHDVFSFLQCYNGQAVVSQNPEVQSYTSPLLPHDEFSYGSEEVNGYFS